jgi:hypothetical protein
LILTHDELTRLNRDSERLLSEARQQAKAAATHEDAALRLSGEIAATMTAVTKADGAKEALHWVDFCLSPPSDIWLGVGNQLNIEMWTRLSTTIAL